MELNSTNVCIFWTLGKSRHRNAQIWVNMVIVMHKKYGKLVIVSSKFVAKYGGYCDKFGKQNGGYWRKFGGYLADILERINGKIWWILPKAGKQNGGYTRKHIIKRKKFRLYTKTYN